MNKMIMQALLGLFFSVSLFSYEYMPLKESSELEKELNHLFAKDINIYYTAGWGYINVYLKTSSKPTVVILKSTALLKKVKFYNSKKANLVAVVYSSNIVEIEVQKSDVKIYGVKYMPELTELNFDLSKCKEQIMTYHCPGSVHSLNRLNKFIKRLLGKNITGFSKMSKGNRINLPNIFLDEIKYKKLALLSTELDNRLEKIKKRKENPFYEESEKRWSKILDIKDIPTNKFRANYMDSRYPYKVVYSEKVDDISLNFDSEKLHGLKAEYLASLWIGDFYFKEKITKEISTSLSWAKINIIINGKSVYKGANSKSFEHTFEKGKHRIEIEFNSNYWHVGFLFSMKNKIKTLDESFFQKISEKTKVYLVGVYSSRRKDHILDLFVKDSNKESILILSSNSPVQWNIINSKNIKAVVFNSYEPGSSVKSDNKNIEIYQDKKISYASRLLPFCYDSPSAYCEKKYAFKDIVKYSQRVFGKRPDGFSSTEAPSLSFKRLDRLDELQPILVPQFKLDSDTYMKIKEQMRTKNK